MQHRLYIQTRCMIIQKPYFKKVNLTLLYNLIFSVSVISCCIIAALQHRGGHDSYSKPHSSTLRKIPLNTKFVSNNHGNRKKNKYVYYVQNKCLYHGRTTGFDFLSHSDTKMESKISSCIL